MEYPQPQRLGDLTRTQLQESRSLDAVRYVSAKIEAAKDFNATPAEIFSRRWPQAVNRPLVEHHVEKALTPAVPLTGFVPPTLSSALAEFGRPYSLLRVPFRRAPFGTPFLAATTGTSGFGWAGHGRPKPVTQAILDRQVLDPAVAAGIVVITNELARLSTPGSAELLRDDLSAGLGLFLSQQLVDPNNAGVAGISPASITNGVTAAASSSGDVIEDLRTVIVAYKAAGGDLSRAVILLSTSDAVALTLRHGANCTPLFPGLTASGGVIGGLPAYASDAVVGQIVAVDAGMVFVSDDGRMDISLSRSATIEMSDAPTNNATTPVLTQQVGLFQTDCTALKVERVINWIRVGALARVDSVNYLGEGGSP